MLLKESISKYIFLVLIIAVFEMNKNIFKISVPKGDLVLGPLGKRGWLQSSSWTQNVDLIL